MLLRLELAFEKKYGQVKPSTMTSDIKGVIKLKPYGSYCFIYRYLYIYLLTDFKRWVVNEIRDHSRPILITANYTFLGKIFGKLSRFPQSELFYPTPKYSLQP